MTRSTSLSRIVLAMFAVLLATTALVTGCTPRDPNTVPVSDATYISSAEIDSSHLSTAYDVIHKLRPQYLTSRGRLSLDPTIPPALPRVYVDNQFYGDATTLRGILTGTIESIRYYSGASAQQKFGHDNAAGVIAIETKH